LATSKTSYTGANEAERKSVFGFPCYKLINAFLAQASSRLEIRKVVFVMGEMARRCYGYGHWDAPYWFIGPEPGQARDENDDLRPRVEAWLHFGGGELTDCREFHNRIGEKRWHRERPQLQATWRPLMLLLMAFLERPTSNENLRNYQRDKWGMLSGDTCVIELSGLAAHSFKVPRDRERFRLERINLIRERMRDHHPELVVMYGTSQRESWELIAGRAFPPDNILSLKSTILAFTPHPTSHGLTNAYWGELGERLRQVGRRSVIAR
jgi:hypothetical protein